jgi:hypothetical protein
MRPVSQLHNAVVAQIPPQVEQTKSASGGNTLGDTVSRFHGSVGLQCAVASSVGCAWKVRCMGKLIYSMITSLDGYTEDEHGRFGWGAPEDEEVHSYINALASSLGTYLYGRRMYETMVYWETAHDPQPTAVRARLGAAVAGGREDRLHEDPSRAAQRTDAR